MDNFINVPNIPVKTVKTVVIDYRTDMEILGTLDELGIKTVKTERCVELYDSIQGHPDILMHHIGENFIVMAPNVFDRLAFKLIKKGFAVTKGDTCLSRNYPQNIAYNVLRIGRYAFHNLKYTDRQIRILYEKMNIKAVNINQGYSKCSVCVINEKSVITSDKGIAKELEKYDIESLLIKPGDIRLEKLNYGFIGGATGLISNSELAFTGYVNNLKDYKRIMEFLDLRGISAKILSSKKIIDIGSIIPLTY